MALVREVNMGHQDLPASLVLLARTVSLVPKEKEALLVRKVNRTTEKYRPLLSAPIEIPEVEEKGAE